MLTSHDNFHVGDTGNPIAADLTRAAVITWMSEAARDEVHSSRWLARHGGRRWLGETDYVGPCDTARDVDCDRWYDHHDNCPRAFNAYQLDSDDDGIGDACDNCPSVKNDYQDNCNRTAELARNLLERGDACDPIPCPRSEWAAQAKTNETCTPNPPGPNGEDNGLACTATFMRRDLDSTPLGSFDEASSSHRVVTGVNTSFRFCQKRLPALDCVGDYDAQQKRYANYKYIRDEFASEPDAETPVLQLDQPWYRVSVAAPPLPPPFRGQTQSWDYGSTVAINRWNSDLDFAHWTTPTPKMEFDGACSGLSCLKGVFWVHGDRPAGEPVDFMGGANAYVDIIPTRELGYCANRPDVSQLDPPEEVDFRKSIVWRPRERLSMRALDLTERPEAAILSKRRLGYAGSLQRDGRFIAASDDGGPCTGTSMRSDLGQRMQDGLRWVNFAEPSARLGSIPTSLVALAYDMTTGRIVDGAAEDEAGALAPAASLTPSLFSASMPPSFDRFQEGYELVFSRVAGGAFVVGGKTYAYLGDTPLGKIWFQALGEAWVEVYAASGSPSSPSFFPGQVRAATYSFADDSLWIVDEGPYDVGGGNIQQRTRLGRINVALKTAEIFAAWPVEGGDHSRTLSVDIDGSILLHHGGSFRIVPTSPPTITRFSSPDMSIDSPIVDENGYTFVLVQYDIHNTPHYTTSRTRTLTQVCCDGTSCGQVTTCGWNNVASP